MDEILYPSITEILSETQPKETRESLEQWKLDTGPERAEQKRQESMARGRRYDEFVAAHYRGEIIPHFSLRQHLDQYQVHSAEQKVKSDQYKYRGRYDIIFIRSGLNILNDFKGAGKPKRKEWLNDYPLQIAAYTKACQEMGTRIDYAMITLILERDIQKFTFTLKDIDYYFQLFLLRREQYKYLHGI